MGAFLMNRERIEARYGELLAAWNRRDADAFAAMFTDDGQAVAFDGSAMSGRAEIASTLAAVFQNERIGAYAASIRDIVEIAPGVILLRSVVGTIPPDGVGLNLMVKATQSIVFLQRDDEAEVVLLQSTPATFHGRSDVAEVLSLELEHIRRSQG
ncbi:MAG TPA: SgcJ/EcaC family oxidoreductase, partial [Vicinamibacterales bacterium]|nr:SgcJ/EcaC family oxidoreductase [Vicinamibacterales bacterium]